jgi:hypothetical protein
MSSTSRENRTTLGHFYYMFAPTRPYQTSYNRIGARGRGGVVELPLTVTPILRLPFWATSLLAIGPGFFKASYSLLKSFECPIQLQFHLSDFVDYRHPELSDQVPQPSDGVYAPKALHEKLSIKISFYRKILDILSEDYRFITLADWPGQLLVDNFKNS